MATPTPSHDTLIWTWTSPTGQQFSGTPHYIEGVKTGWDARANSKPACKYSETCGARR